MEYLSTEFKDDILNTEVNKKRKYRMIYNSDGTVSFEDVTVYSQTGTAYGAKEVIEEREKINELLDILFPIGIVITLSTDDPVFQQKTPMDLGYPGQWEPFADGRCIMGYKKGDSDFAFGYEGGSKTVTLTVGQIPSHSHRFTVPDYTYYVGEGNTGEGAHDMNEPSVNYANNTTNTGGGQPHNNMPPYKVARFWERVS